MDLVNVYSQYEISPIAAKGSTIMLDNGDNLLDFYGGHGVISVGHGHPIFIDKLKAQLDSLVFYSNAVLNPLQSELAGKLGTISGCPLYDLFLCNSGAESNENALKLASFKTGKSKVLAFRNSFHGRTSAAVAVTDIPSINAPINKGHEVVFAKMEDFEFVGATIEKGDLCAVIIEGIQGVGGLDEPSTAFFKFLQSKCTQYEVVLIVDEIQSGYGRSGDFFAHQRHGIEPDIITMAKGMGNGFPIAGLLLKKGWEIKKGMLGTTFGGNHLACSAGIAVLDILDTENVLHNVDRVSNYLLEELKGLNGLQKIKGRGLMLGLEFDFAIAELREKLLLEQKVFTGASSNKNLLRILPPLTITTAEVDVFVQALKAALKNLNHG